MSRYANIDKLTELIRQEWVKYMPMELDMNLSFVLGKIDEVPSIEIIRCKDCKHYDDLDERGGWCRYHKKTTYVQCFCSEAERREE